jgi:4-alpha-glucanotransferase
MPVFSLRREGDLGIGDTRALQQAIDWASSCGIGFLQLLPINENGADESPYSAISSAALDPIYLTLDHQTIPWLNPSDFTNAHLRLASAAHASAVHYPVVRKVKRDLLELAWSRFDDAGQHLRESFSEFQKSEHAWLRNYCCFKFLMEYFGDHLMWDEWPDNCQTPAKANTFLESLRHRTPQQIDHRLSFFAFVQWLCYSQWRDLRSHADAKSVKLMGDIPIGISWHSCDVFFHQEEFHMDWFGGGPAEGGGHSDPFFREWGQNWGIPLYRWDHMEANGFQWWKTRIRHVTRFFHMFRLDHILGFYRIYAFPWHPRHNPEFIGLSHHEAAQRTGGRLPRWFLRPDDTVDNKAANRADGDLRLRAILEAADDIDIIAEDLGWVPEYVRPHLTDLGIAGFRIPHWDCNEYGHPTPGNCFPENSFATYSTHDHDPVCGIWRGCLETIRRHQENPDEHTGWQSHNAHNTLRVLSEFAGIPMPSHAPWPPFTEGVRLRLIKALFDSNSRFAVLMVTSLFGIDQRINEPGTIGSKNWTFRLPWTMEKIQSDPQLVEISRRLAATIHVTKRQPLPPK